MGKQIYNPLLEDNFQELNPAGTGGGDLASTLALGHTTGTNNITVADGQKIWFGFEDLVAGHSIEGEAGGDFFIKSSGVIEVESGDVIIKSNDTDGGIVQATANAVLLKSGNLTQTTVELFSTAVNKLALKNAVLSAPQTQTFQDASGTIALLSDVGITETFYLERVETIDEGSATPIEYFTEVQNGTEISNVVSAIGGTYTMDISIVCTNTSAGGYVIIEPKIGATSVFVEPYAKQPKATNDIFYVNISKRVTLAVGNNTINLELSNDGGGAGRIYEANITLKKI